MKQDNVVAFDTPQQNEDPLTELLRSGAKRLIQQAVEAELGEVLTGVGPVSVQMPKVRSRTDVISHPKGATRFRVNGATLGFHFWARTG